MTYRSFFIKFAQYSGIGVALFILEYLAYVLLVTHGGMGYLPATILTFLCGLTLQYAITRRFVFSHTIRPWTTGYVMFAGGACIGVALISFSMIVLVEHLQVSSVVARPIAGALVGFASYVFNCFGTFGAHA